MNEGLSPVRQAEELLEREGPIATADDRPPFARTIAMVRIVNATAQPMATTP